VIKLRKIDTVLFDLDGTLIDSNDLIIKCFDMVFKKYLPNTLLTKEQLIEMVGPPLKETFKIVSKNPDVIQDMIDFYRECYLENEFAFIDIYPNVLDTLKILKNRGFNLGVVSTKFSTSAMPSIEHYCMDKYFNTYSFLDDVNEHKPHPEPIFYALKQLKNYNNVLFVGDNTSDILAGRNASVLTCGVEWSMKKELIKALKPDFWINNFTDLVTIHLL